MATDFDCISDSRLSGFLKRQISLLQPCNPKLKNLKLCGSQIIKQQGVIPAVYLLSDGKEKSRFFGHTSCHSAWSCPKCMPIVMAKKGTDIACAIDALAAQKKYAFMITFTLPHNKYMSCQDAMSILQLTWRHFIRETKRHKKNKYVLKSDVQKQNISFGKKYIGGYCGSKNEFDQRAVGKKGETKVYNAGNNVWGGFREDFGLKHTVRVYEFTWSNKNGWHPHIHALYWTDKKNFEKILEREDELVDFWWHCAKLEALKYWNKRFPDKKEENKIAVEEYYTDWRKHSLDGHKSVYISRDKKNPNKAAIKESSFYIAGWSGDAELTSSNYKQASEGHLTPYQMLEKAYNDARLVDTYIPLYLEYCNTVYGRRRVEFSKTGLLQIIRDWKKTQTFKEKVKKKFTEKLGTRKFKVVYWFNEQQWKQICYLELETDEEPIAELLQRARAPNARDEIEKYLWALDIPLSPLCGEVANFMNNIIKHIEEKVFENRFAITA